jgi:CheY-like chemotaxis protein
VTTERLVKHAGTDRCRVLIDSDTDALPLEVTDDGEGGHGTGGHGIAGMRELAVGEAATGVEAVELAGTEEPQLVLMDIRMPVMDGIEATRRITAAYDEVRVLILTPFDLDEYVFAALRAGPAGSC